MAWSRVVTPVLLAGCTAIASLSAMAQTAPAQGKRQKVDVRAMVPGPDASEAAAAAEARPAGAGLTRDQRKEATLQARNDGTLQPAGEAADPHRPASAAVTDVGVRAKPAPLATGSAPALAPAPSTEVAGANRAEPAPKSLRKKGSSASAASPA